MNVHHTHLLISCNNKIDSQIHLIQSYSQTINILRVCVCALWSHRPLHKRKHTLAHTHTHPSISFQWWTMFLGLLQVPVHTPEIYTFDRWRERGNWFRVVHLFQNGWNYICCCMSFDTMRNRISHCFSSPCYGIHKLWISHFIFGSLKIVTTTN